MFRALILSALAGTLSSTTLAHADPDKDWRPVPAERLLILTLESGEVILELNDDFAPAHVAQFSQHVSEGLYDGERFYRVIDGFVAQAGLQDDEVVEEYPKLTNENDRPLSDTPFAQLGNEDLFAPETGHMAGFPVARDEELGREWLLHCPGALAMARDTDPDTGSTEFYIVLDAQRYLDRNLTVFGRVLSGMKHIQALTRGDMSIAGGVIQPPAQGDLIISAKLASDMPEADRPSWEVMVTPSDRFEDFKTSKRVREEAFFYRKPPEILDICSFSTPARPTPDKGE